VSDRGHPDDFVLLGGSASRRLTAAVAGYLDRPVAKSEVLRFSDGNLFVRVLENVRGRDVFLIQGTAFPANDNFMELLFWLDALKRASAASVTAVIPYFSYAKGDKMDEPRVSIRARVCASAIEASRRTRACGRTASARPWPLRRSGERITWSRPRWWS
jgi:ribose-phosphate pyrophosphokinase